VKHYNHLVQIADTPDAFVAAVELSLTEDSLAKQKRSEAMVHENWTEKVATICDYIEGCCSRKGKP